LTRLTRDPRTALPQMEQVADERAEGGEGRAWRRQGMEQLRSGVRDGRVVEMDAGHHLFLHRPDEVLQLVRDFLRQP
jgi:pimeloyl-ACP methyl ester carboxylesterase